MALVKHFTFSVTATTESDVLTLSNRPNGDALATLNDLGKKCDKSKKNENRSNKLKMDIMICRSIYRCPKKYHEKSFWQIFHAKSFHWTSKQWLSGCRKFLEFLCIYFVFVSMLAAIWFGDFDKFRMKKNHQSIQSWRMETLSADYESICKLEKGVNKSNREFHIRWWDMMKYVYVKSVILIKDFCFKKYITIFMCVCLCVETYFWNFFHCAKYCLKTWFRSEMI